MTTTFPPPPRAPAIDRQTGGVNPRDFARWVQETRDYLDRLVTAVLDASDNVLDASDTLTEAQDDIDALETRMSTAETDITALEAAAATFVVGPASATDDALVRFNGATGKLVQNSTGTLTDAGVLNVDGSYQVDGVKVVGNQGAAVADAAGGATIDAEARTALNALLARVRAHGLIAT